MKIGLVGKPNVGKSTFFSAATAVDAQIGDYPFTTIDAQHGVAAVRVQDPGPPLGVESTPRTGSVLGPYRLVPVEVVDVAGLVPGAHEGRGLGNRFLTDLSRADALIHVVDASGSSDAEGNPLAPGARDPLEDVAFLEHEIDAWIQGLLEDDWERVARRVQQENRKLASAISQKLQGIGIDEAMAVAALRASGLADKKPAEVGAEDRRRLARSLRMASKPILVAWNKADKAGKGRLDALRAKKDGVATSAHAELALQKGLASGALDYIPGTGHVESKRPMNDAQRSGLDYIRSHVLEPFGSTGVAQALEKAAFGMLRLIPVFPVEDETRYTDKEGRVLPDCHLVPEGTTAKQLAYRVHTDLGDGFIRGIDCRTRRVIGADQELKAGDVVKIVA